jgi:predicted ATPase
MDKKILNIVITGGPCGGKTTALGELANLLRSYGYTVYICSETATELISGGIKPYGDNKLELADFQELLLDAQIYKEKIRREAARRCPNDKVAILYDRGILDNRAYIDYETFGSFLVPRGMTESGILSSYDMVIHLVTAAIGREECYTTDNNVARTETVEEAREMDYKTMKTWMNHPNQRIISNDTLFDEKIEKVKNCIRAYLGEKEVIKRERYLLDINTINLQEFKNKYDVIEEHIEEFVDSYDDVHDVMYSKSTISGSNFYLRTSNEYDPKYPATVSKPIRGRDYDEAEAKMKGAKLHKIRYNFIDNHERFRLDYYYVGDNCFTILERDVSQIRRKSLPAFVKNAVNITNNRDYNDDSIFIDYNIGMVYKKIK